MLGMEEERYVGVDIRCWCDGIGLEILLKSRSPFGLSTVELADLSNINVEGTRCCASGHVAAKVQHRVGMTR